MIKSVLEVNYFKELSNTCEIIFASFYYITVLAKRNYSLRLDLALKDHASVVYTLFIYTSAIISMLKPRLDSH